MFMYTETIMTSPFVHLHTHSHYSLLNALPKIPELVKRAEEEGMSALALTDNGNMYGAIKFYKECRRQGIKPIIGVDFYVAARTRHDRQAGLDNRRARLVLLAKNDTGYKNLIKLVSESHLTGFYYKPRIDRELMKKYSEGLVAIVPSFSGEVVKRLKVADKEGAEKILNEYKNIYGNDLYLEISHHPNITDHSKHIKQIIELAKNTKTEIVGAQEIFYMDPNDREARNTLLSIQASAGLGSFPTGENEDFSFISSGKVIGYFKDTPSAIKNTVDIASKCNLELTLDKAHFPNFIIPEGTTYDSELERLTYEGLAKRRMEKTSEVAERIEYELNIIEKKGYSPYFLVVGDLIRFAKENGIASTIRGSVAGSLVTYLMGITTINPLDYGLKFERFMYMERPSLPDIDMDFADNRRDEVIKYARNKYGNDHVAQIGTFGTMLARGSVRDVARALNFPYDTGDRIAKLIPLGSQGFPMTIERALSGTAELAELYKSNPDTKKIIDMAKKVEGCARHISVHAAGVVISPTPLINYVPLQLDPKGGKLITQYDMYSVSEEYGGAGLVKFDVLGLKNLAILTDSVKRVRWRKNETVDLDNIPLDDKKTFDMLSRGETTGTFQLNGTGMTHFLKELKPTSIHDINAMVALYRPGPMEFIPEYIRRKNNPSAIDYPHPLLKEDLEKSYGLLIYQEDVMMAAIKLAGYSWPQADKFRKAMGKKIPALMAEQEGPFKSGCISNGISEKLADDLWNKIKPFAAYAFNKAHSASYGRVAYQTSYMKANYPQEYMAAVLTADSGNVDKISEMVMECKKIGIEILPPSINESFGTFTVVDRAGMDSAIRFGLFSIKNFGEGIGGVIIEERKTNGKFKSITDFLERIHDRNLNKKSLDALIMSGAFDSFAERGALLTSVENLLAYNKEISQTIGQDSLFGLMSDQSSVPSLTLSETPPATMQQRLAWEKDLLGLYVSGHPLDRIKDKLENREQTIAKISSELKPGMMAVVAGLVESVKPITTKKGEAMAFVKISDYTGSIETVIFPRIFEKYKTLIEAEKCIAIRGRLSDRNQETSLIAEAIKEL